MKKIYGSKILKKIISFAIAMLMTFENLPIDKIDNMDFSFFERLAVHADEQQDTTDNKTYDLTLTDVLNDASLNISHTDNDNLVINSAKQVIALSNVNPNEYQNKTISIVITENDYDLTSVINLTINGTAYNLNFRGFGNSANPYKGKFTVSGFLTLNCPLFNYIYDSTDISFNGGTYQTLTVTAQEGNFCLFDNVIHDNDNNNSTLNVQNVIIKTFTTNNNENSEDVSVGGIINHLSEKAKACLNFSVNIADDKYLVSNSEDAGIFCNTMGENSELTINGFNVSSAESGTPKIKVTAGNGNAGGAVGVMNEGAKLKFNSNLTLEGTITATSSAGGIIGSAYSNSNVEVTDTNKVTINSMKVGGDEYSGGVIGNFVSSTDNTFDFSNIIISDVTCTKGDSAGGLFGKLENQSGTFTIKSGNVTVTATETSIINCGGLIGTYSSSSLDNTLEISDINAVVSISANISGGIIGKLNSDNSVYANIGNINITYGEKLMGGLVGNAGNGNMLDIGDTTISSKDSKEINGGLVYQMDSGVMRISGTTDLSAVIYENSTSSGQILGIRGNGTLVYATENWIFKRTTKENRISDIGSYGEVLRLSEKLKEYDLFDIEKHCITVKQANNTINNLTDFALLSVSIQAYDDQYTGNGALKLTSTNNINYNITIAENVVTIDLTGTGITGLTRDDGTQTFSNTFDGNNNTIIFATGEIYGCDDVQTTTAGNGQIYNHQYIGLFGQIKNANISNVKIDGVFNFGTTDKTDNIKMGMITAYATGLNNFTNVEILSNATINFERKHQKSIHVGGFIGSTKTNTTINFDSCSWQGTINKSGTGDNSNNKFYIGGFIGYSNNSTINININTVGGKIYMIENTTDFTVGGLIGYTYNGTININGLNIDNAAISTLDNSTSGKTGGLLGYEWSGTTVNITNLNVSNSSINMPNKFFGGLVYQASGYWNVSGNGINYKKNISFTGQSDTSTPSALLVSSGNALYLEIRLNDAGDSIAYSVNSSTEINIPESSYFDELVGKSIDGGVVSIATIDHEKIDTVSCNTYKKQLSTDYNNSQTRYYYNIDDIRMKESPTGGEKMLLWSLNKYSASTIKTYFTNYFTDGITGEIDLTGLSYYPIDISEDVNIKDATITFDYQQIESTETNANNKKLSDAKKQHYKMQCGIFNDVKSKTSSSNTVTVTNLTLKGDFGGIDSGSGALICGTISGNSNGTTSYTSTVNVTGVNFDGIVIKNKNNDYSPLLINKIGNYSSVGITRVTATYTTNDTIATSLIGKAGGSDGTDISLTFSKIELNGKVDNSIFSHATLLESFEYKQDRESSCFGNYTFSKSDTATYGQELSNTDDGTVSGRNNGKQYYYFDVSEYVSDTINGVTTTNNSDTASTYFATDYLRYVYQKEEITDINDVTRYYRELDINQRKDDMITGCGTYGDPYIITDGEQLKNITNPTANANWVIQINKTAMENQNGVLGDKYHTQGNATDDVYIKQSSSGTWTIVTPDEDGNFPDLTTESKADYTAEQVLAYLRNAYYMIAPTNDAYSITLGGGTFSGIGANDSTKTFSGVIVGKEKNGKLPTIKIQSPSENQTQYGGLIQFADGCVIKDLIIDYTDAEITMSEATDTATIPKARGTDPNNDLVNPNQTSDKQNFFGGVIGYVWGGDNIIDNVQVKYADTSVKTTIGNNEKLINIGGYVGLVGGQYTKGGTVIFRNMTDDYKLTKVNGTDIINENNDDVTVDKYYWNPYVGRVLDGSVIYDGINSSSENDTWLSNTNKNYTIPSIQGKDGIPQLDVTVWAGNDEKNSTNIVKIDNAEELLILSQLCASGASASNSSGYYAHGATGDTSNGNSGKNKLEAYYEGKVRSGAYNDVGIAETEPETVKNDEEAWGGISGKNNKIPYLVRNFTKKYSESNDATKFKEYHARRITGNGCNFNIELNSDCDMSIYGNGFRGFGSAFTNAIIASGGKGYSERKILNIITFNGNGHTIKFERDVYEYPEETVWHTYQVGLFTEVYAHSTGTGKKDGSVIYDLTLSGSVIVENQNNNADCQTYAGAYAGMRKYSSAANKTDVTFKNVKLKDMTVTGAAKASGGLIGYINQGQGWTFENCSYYNITVSAINYAGGYVGWVNGGNSIIINSTADTTLNGAKITVSKEGNNDIYAGGIIGYLKKPLYINCDTSGNSLESETLTISNFNLIAENSAVNKNSYLGGVVGGAENTVVYINNLNVSKTNIYNGSTAGTNWTAGLVAYTNSAISIDNVTVDEFKTLNYGNTGGLIGNTSNKDIYISNTSVTNSCIVTTQQPSTSKNDNATAGLIGKMSTANKTLYGYNILLSNNLIGYYMNGTTNISSDDINKLNKDTVGLGEATKANNQNVANNKAYSEITEMKNDRVYKDYSSAGTLVGRCGTIYLKIVGLSVQGDYIPNEEIGYATTSQTLINDGSYIIYADYTGNSTKTEKNTTGKAPYVVVNPKSVVSGQEDIINTDGVAWYDDKTSIGQQIASESQADSTKWNMIYNKVTSIAKQFQNPTSSDEQTTSITNYYSKMSTYNTVGENDTTVTNDFPVLLIDETDSEKITKMIQSYASLLTNENLDEGTWSSALEEISCTTYQLNTSDNKFYKTNVSTLKAKNSSISINSGGYDNTKNQFTVITLKYKSPTSDDYYELQISVLVKKVLTYTFDSVVKSGTDYYSSAYDADKINSIALANNGEPVTAFITFTYERTIEEWETYMNSGENLIDGFNKVISVDELNSLKNATLVLVDANKYSNNKANYGAYYMNYTEGSKNVKLSDFDGWSAVSLCDLLQVQEKDSDCTLTNDDTIFEKTTADEASVKIGTNYYKRVGTLSEIKEKNYEISEDLTIEDLKKLNEEYTVLTINPDEAQKTTGEKGTYLKECYYITIETSVSDTSSKCSRVQRPTTTNALIGTSIPTQYGGGNESSDFNRYIIGNIYNQELTFKTTNTNFEISESNHIINGTITSKINLSSEIYKLIGSNSNVKLNHELDFSLIKRKADSSISTVAFEYETQVTVKNYKITSGDKSEEKEIIYCNDFSSNRLLAKSGAISENASDFTSMINNQNGCTITADVEINISSENYREQFDEDTIRDENKSENIGIYPKVYSKLGTNGNYLTSTGNMSELYYTTGRAEAELEVDADSKDLGINPTDLSSNQKSQIHSTITYDLADVYDKTAESVAENSDKTVMVEYEITLYQKDDDQYKQVNINDYLEFIKFSADGEEINNNNNSWIFTIEWNDSDSLDFKKLQNASLDFEVKTGKDYENENLTYANYKVQVKAKLYYEGESNSPIESTSVEDHIIYTNARLCIDKVK